ncbi:hypothetical protein C8R48DRAFT_240339 [Suillus tomentosus]|nr:hypothetical protein C8R48DRAFT_240339 [Suillus tomentosus]
MTHRGNESSTCWHISSSWVMNGCCMESTGDARTCDRQYEGNTVSCQRLSTHHSSELVFSHAIKVYIKCFHPQHPKLLKIAPPAQLRLKAMSELRKRQDPGKVGDTDPQNVLPRSTSVLSSVLSGFDRPRLVILILLAAFAAWFLSPEETSSLSHSYAVCSSSGARIYTVDHAVPNAQCLVVDGSLILDIGSLGMSN